MKKMTIILPIAVLILTLSGCDFFGLYGSGTIIETTYTLDNFTAVDASHACQVTITRGAEYSVTVSIDDNILPYMRTYKTGNVLYIDIEPVIAISHSTFRAHIVMPDLTYLELSGASYGDVTGFSNSGTFTANLSGASRAVMDFTDFGSLNSDLSGASSLTINAEKSNGRLDLECSGASSCDVRELTLSDADVDVSGASTIYVNLSGSLSGDISGASAVYYRENLSFGDIDLSGGSVVTRF